MTEPTWTRLLAGDMMYYNHPQKFLCSVCKWTTFAEAKVYSRIPNNGLYPVSSFTPIKEEIFRKVDGHEDPVAVAKLWCEEQSKLLL